MECIVLAGGLGTRLRGVIGAYPKCMATVNGKPFLHYVFQYLEEQGCTRVVLSLGYEHQVITDWLQTEQRSFDIAYVIEDEPLGTGGGIQKAIQAAKAPQVGVLNGDTMFRVQLHELFAFHEAHGAHTTLALKKMQHFDRYGVVRTDAAHRIISFEEKRAYEEGDINGGIYAINKAAFLLKELPEKFSFEKDYLERYIDEHAFYGYHSDAYFIDIGIPTDYEQAQHDFQHIFS
jgi:D-glycero-alpha-D-manno-heptose 1-phosphate guanylyltransferase